MLSIMLNFSTKIKLGMLINVMLIKKHVIVKVCNLRSKLEFSKRSV